MKNGIKPKRKLWLYYLDCNLQLQKEPLQTQEAKITLEKCPEYVVGVYDMQASRDDILSDAESTKDALRKKCAA